MHSRRTMICKWSFENAFPYDETEDQLRSIAEVKRDMEKERPMDRFFAEMLDTEKRKWQSGQRLRL